VIFSSKYDLAQRAQALPDLPEAIVHYQSFLASTLLRLAQGQTTLGNQTTRTVSRLRQLTLLCPSKTRIFREMTTSFGDKATLHLDFGRAFAEAGYPDLAIAEFNKASAKDPTLAEAHCCLGASYLLSIPCWSKARPSFAKARKLLQNSEALHLTGWMRSSCLDQPTRNRSS
jgi:hypothetical protein